MVILQDLKKVYLFSCLCSIIIYNHILSYSGIVGLKQTAFSYIIFIFGLRLHFIARSLRFCTHVHEWSNFEKENKKLHPV